MENTILQDGDSPERANASLDERRHGATFAMNSKRPSEECPPSFPTVGLSRTLFSLSCFGIYAYAILSMAYICLSESQQ